jgi:hypothetical protein
VASLQQFRNEVKKGKEKVVEGESAWAELEMVETMELGW